MVNVIAYTQVTLDDGDPYLFLFYSDSTVSKYNLKKQYSVACMNQIRSAGFGPNNGGLQAAAALVSMLNNFGLIKR